MNIKRAVMIAVLAVAVAALAVPLVGLNARAAGSAANAKSSVAAAKANAAAASRASQNVQKEVQQEETAAAAQSGANGKISAETVKALGIKRLAKGVSPQAAAKALAKKITQGNPSAQILTALPPGSGPGGAYPVHPPAAAKPGGVGPPLVGQPLVLNELSALSAALITTIGGRDNQFSEVALIADWDGREDCAADRGAKIDDFSFVEPDIDFSLTRAAISEHTFANGHLFNSYYYGDSLGNLYFGFDLVGSPLVDTLFQANIPAIVNGGAAGAGGFRITDDTRVAGDCADDQVTVTGIAVQPVADLADFAAAPNTASPLCGVTGEVIYVSVLDTEGCASNAANQPIRTRIFAFAIFEAGGTEFVVPDVRQVMRSKFSNIAGVSVDDDGSLYFQLADLIQFTGGALFKATEVCHTAGPCGPAGNPRTNRVIRSIPDPPTLNSWSGTGANPIVTANGVRNTNYGGGSSTLFGDIVSITNGGGNVLYAAVARSFVPGDVSFEQLTEGLFPAPSALGATPSMIISFADCSGRVDFCSGEATGGVTTNVGGILPVADGIADGPVSGVAPIPGVNNFRLFALGNGPDLRPAAGGTALIPGTPSTLLKVDMQIDFSLYSGINVSQEGAVFVISGGTPAGIGKNPSPMLGEILCFEDGCPADRRADFVDLRGDTLPNPPASGGNVGDGDSDRFDHIFYQAPLDQLTFTPAGLAGLARGFLRYTNRLAPVAMGPGVDLGVTKGIETDDDTTGADTDADGVTDVPAPIIFENLDPGHQVAGGDDQNTPFRGDDNDGAGSPPLAGALAGGFEFTFGGPVGTNSCTWNGFFLNSNGSVTFGGGDLSFTPNVPDFRTGLPKIAPAWVDLNPASRAENLCTFPVQAVGFANVNAFKVLWINVPEIDDVDCVGTLDNLAGYTNTFSVTLYDDGTGPVVAGVATSSDENNSRAFNPANPIGNNSVAFDWAEGPTDLRFTRVNTTNPVGGTLLVGCPPRPSGSGIFIFDYARMDLLGTADHPVITGYSIGGLDPLNPPGLCEVNLSIVAAQADAGTFGVLTGGQIAAVACNCCIGEGTEPTIFELFNEGLNASTGAGGEITFARPDFDLRFEGNDAAICTSSRQRDLNRGRICFLGISCNPPTNPTCLAVLAGTNAVTPTTSGLVNTLCAVQLNLIGCGFFPNEVTTICQGFQAETGVPLQRPGKTVTTAATLACDTNGDGIADSTVALVNVTPVSCNLVTATIPVSGAFGAQSSSGFPPTCCGGAGAVTITTTFSAGDNNAFGPFTRTSVCALTLGTRAPVVNSVSPSSGPCAIIEDVLITGACFIINGVPNVTSVFALDRANTATRINAQDFFIVNANLIDAHFNFTSANAGKTFLIFVSGPNGTSRNLTTAVTGAPAGCPLGNEFGVQVTFTCDSNVNPNPGPTPDIAVVTSCHLDRQDTGQFFLDVTGTNIKDGATATVGGVTPKKIKVVEVSPGTTNPTKLRLIKKVCNGLPGNVIITNPGTNGGPSQPFACTERCPAQ